MIRFYKIALTLPIILVVSSCYHNEEVANSLPIRKSTVYNFEIEIPVHHEGRGNIHQMDPSKFEFDASDWIYLNDVSSTVNFDKLILTHERNKTERPWCQSNLKGYLKFKKDSVSINLILPEYKNEDTIVDGWSNYKYNGTYKLTKLY